MTELLGRATALLVCVVGLPIHLAVCLAIRLQDLGPAIYSCRRLGCDGTSYTMFKYRSMTVGCSPLIGSGFKVAVAKNDTRVTPLGRILRCGIDELPQLWNVVRGEMAWVGPRPDESWMLPKYGLACHERLHSKPGITGLAQVLDSRNFPTALGYAIDIWYNRYRTLFLDLWVISRTPFFVLGWRSIGSARLRRLLRDEELLGIAAACEKEVNAAEKAVA
jgi:lipopolysaccharide/colanic/teichoic acid biosynthesis glycosyltransferase